VTFSGSKTFGAYGMRMGALIGLSRKADFLKDAREKVLALARGMWSATPTPAIELLNLMFEEERKPDFLQGLAKARQTIIRRGHLFLKQAQEVDLPLVPYINGFYTIVKCPNSYACYEKLAKNHIYAVPVEQGIRIALCSLSLKDIDGLALKLKSIMFCS
jgi:aspartate/tyrosine/aromatic aminotransferase